MIKQLIKNIFLRFLELEDNNTQYYYCHREFDSNVTKFESLSNANVLVLKTGLPFMYIEPIMRIFQCIYDDNYYIFEENSRHIVEMLDDNLEEDFYSDLIKRLYSLEDIDAWFEYFEITKEEDIGENQRYNTIPIIDDRYKSRRYKEKQEIYTIQKLIIMIE